MNKIRRKALAEIITKLEELENLRSEIAERLEEIMDEEQEALDNMPDSLQESERGQQMQEYIDTMSSVLDDLGYIDTESMGQQLEEITEG